MAKLVLKSKDSSKYIELIYIPTTTTYMAKAYEYVDLDEDDQIVGTYELDAEDNVKISVSSYSKVTTASTIVGTMNRNFYPYKAYVRHDLPGHIMLGIDVFLDNPYKYINKLEGFSFWSADIMAKCHDIPDDWEPRIRAGIPHFIEEIMRFKGHTVMPKRVLTNLLLEKLGTSLPNDWGTHESLRQVDGDKIGLERVMYWEEQIFNRFKERESHRTVVSDAEIATFMKWLDVPLGRDQKKAFNVAIKNQFSLIPGTAGTGKTTLIKSLYKWFRSRGHRVALCAFTGKAAQRMKDVVEHDAKTIHRTFGGGHGGWGKNRDNPIDESVVIVDEASMLSSELLYRVVDGTLPDTRIILVGDTNQLQPIGMGCPFADMLKGNFAPAVKLAQVFRTAKGSSIAENAAAILNGDLVRHNDDDWIVAQMSDAKKVKESIKNMVIGLHSKGEDIIDDLLILTPNKQSKQSLSTHWLNKMLHDVYMDLVGEADYRGYGPIKRKVIQVKNSYETGIMNGTLGVQLAEENRSRFFSDTKSYFFETVGDVELDQFNQGFLEDAYAMTVHKAQGSEAPFVIVVVHSQSERMLNRKWFYTAVTRAKNKVIVIGDARGLMSAVSHDIQDNRTTYMAHMIHEINNEIPF